MPKNLEVTVEDQRVHIQPLTAQALTDAVKALIAVSPEDGGGEIITSTEKPGLLGIKVSLTHATLAGLIDGDPEANAKGPSASAVDNGKALADAEAQRQAEADDKAAQVLADREEAERAEAEAAEAAAAAEKAAADEAAPKPEPASDGTADAPAEDLTPAQKAANTRKAKEAAARAAAEKAATQG